MAHHHFDDDDLPGDFGHEPRRFFARRSSPDDEVCQELIFLRRRVRELERQLAPYVACRAVDPHDPDGGDDDLHCPHGGRIAAHYLRRESR